MIKTAAQSSLLNDTRYTSMSAGVVPSTEYLISTTVLPALASSVTLDASSFAGIYKHLKVVIAIAPRDDQWLNLRINNDTTNANYRVHFLRGTGSVVNSFSSGGEAGAMNYLYNIGDNIASSIVVDILDAYSTTKNKVIRTFGGSTNRSVIFGSGLWMSTNSITTLEFSPNVGNWAIGSRFSLYGVTA